MVVTSLVAVIAPRTAKIFKKCLSEIQKKKNDVLRFVLRQSSEIALES